MKVVLNPSFYFLELRSLSNKLPLEVSQLTSTPSAQEISPIRKCLGGLLFGGSLETRMIFFFVVFLFRMLFENMYLHRRSVLMYVDASDLPG